MMKLSFKVLFLVLGMVNFEAQAVSVQDEFHRRALASAAIVIPVAVSAEDTIKKVGLDCQKKTQLKNLCVLDAYNQLGEPEKDLDKAYVRVLYGTTTKGLIVVQQFFPDGMPRTNQVASGTLRPGTLDVQPDDGPLYIYYPNGQGSFYIQIEQEFKQGARNKNIWWSISGEKIS